MTTTIHHLPEIKKYITDSAESVKKYNEANPYNPMPPMFDDIEFALRYGADIEESLKQGCTVEREDHPRYMQPGFDDDDVPNMEDLFNKDTFIVFIDTTTAVPTGDGHIVGYKINGHRYMVWLKWALDKYFANVDGLDYNKDIKYVHYIFSCATYSWLCDFKYEFQDADLNRLIPRVSVLNLL